MTDELVIPVPAECKRPIEMARLWIDGDEGVSHISLNYGLFDDAELSVWGSLAADMIAHAVNAYLQDGGEAMSEEAFALVEKGLRERLAKNPTLKGRFGDRTLS